MVAVVALTHGENTPKIWPARSSMSTCPAGNISFDENLLNRIDRAAEASCETRSGFLAKRARARLAGSAAA
jgi:hypothetical protein